MKCRRAPNQLGVEGAGKGNKERIVQVPQDVIDELSSYLASRGLDPDLEAVSNRGAYLLAK